MHFYLLTTSTGLEDIGLDAVTDSGQSAPRGPPEREPLRLRLHQLASPRRPLRLMLLGLGLVLDVRLGLGR